jgi:hypothetical protein
VYDSSEVKGVAVTQQGRGFQICEILESSERIGWNVANVEPDQVYAFMEVLVLALLLPENIPVSTTCPDCCIHAYVKAEFTSSSQNTVFARRMLGHLKVAKNQFEGKQDVLVYLVATFIQMKPVVDMYTLAFLCR